MKKIYIITILFLTFSFLLYSQNAVSNDYSFTNPFRVYDVDKYYVGWQDPRAFIGRLLFAKNFDVHKNLMAMDNSANWDFKSVSVYIEGRLASEIMFYRNKYFSVGMGAGMDISILGRNTGLFDVYDFAGQFAVFADLWLQNIAGINMKIRFIPMYHQSTHLVDGFKGDYTIRSGSSYEFASVAAYYYIKNFTVYLGTELSYNAVGNSPHGINGGAILDKKDRLGLIKEPWHGYVNIGVGLEFYRFTVALKYGFGKPRGASSYFGYENKIGLEISLLF